MLRKLMVVGVAAGLALGGSLMTSSTALAAWSTAGKSQSWAEQQASALLARAQKASSRNLVWINRRLDTLCSEFGVGCGDGGGGNHDSDPDGDNDDNSAPQNPIDNVTGPTYDNDTIKIAGNTLRVNGAGASGSPVLSGNRWVWKVSRSWLEAQIFGNDGSNAQHDALRFVNPSAKKYVQIWNGGSTFRIAVKKNFIGSGDTDTIIGLASISVVKIRDLTSPSGYTAT